MMVIGQSEVQLVRLDLVSTCNHRSLKVRKSLRTSFVKKLRYIQSVLQTVGKEQERTHPSACD